LCEAGEGRAEEDFNAGGGEFLDGFFAGSPCGVTVDREVDFDAAVLAR